MIPARVAAVKNIKNATAPQFNSFINKYFL